MRQLFLFITFLLTSTLLVAFSANAQTVNPAIHLTPTTVAENTPYTLLATGCLPNNQATFYWTKEGGDEDNSGKVDTSPTGLATYPHKEGFSRGTYSIKVHCENTGKESPPKTLTAVAECEYVESLSTTTPKPHTTTTSFTIKGKIRNCPNYSGSGITLRGGDQPDNGRPSYQITRTDAQGNFTLEGVVLEKVGNYTLTMYGVVNNRVQPLTGNSTLAITTTEGGDLACGDAAAANDDRCPDSCPAVWKGGDDWFCEAINCKPAEEVLEELNECATDKKLEETVACSGDIGVGCSDEEAELCYQGEKEVENIKCESGDAPPPLPPNAQCLTYDPPLSEGGEETPRRCVEVNTGIGSIATSPEGFVKALFGVLLSLSGGIALLLIIRSGYQMMMSQGEPEKLKEARERLTSVVVGLLFLIFSLVILEIIGVDILGLPGLG